MVAKLWRRFLLARRGYRDLDRATHGAFGFSTAAKLLAWGGLCAIVLLLLHKIHRIQEQLDPVGRGLEQLQEELRSAGTTVEADTHASETELEALRGRAARLEEALDAANKEQHDKNAPALTRAENDAHELIDSIDRESQALQAVAAQRGTVAKDLADYDKVVTQGRIDAQAQVAGVADAGGAAQMSLRTLADAARQSAAKLDDGQVHQQMQALAAEIQAVQKSLADLQKRADAANVAMNSIHPAVKPLAAVKTVAVAPSSKAALATDPR